MGHGFCMTLQSIRKRFHGFSLMEVMIVVVIIGILAALAYPNLENTSNELVKRRLKPISVQSIQPRKSTLPFISPMLKISMNLTLAWLR